MRDEPHPEYRLSDGERRAVADALAAHAEAGRLTAEELEDRQVAAARAVNWSDVVPLFADLPQPYPPGLPGARARAYRVAVPTPPDNDGALDERPSGAVEPHRVVDGRRPAIMMIAAICALAVFWRTGVWFVFLFLPMVSAFARWNGPDDRDDGRGRGRYGKRC